MQTSEPPGYEQPHVRAVTRQQLSKPWLLDRCKHFSDPSVNQPLRNMLYTGDEVARLAKVCARTIARDVREGRLEEIRFNRRRLRYSRGAIEAYLAGNYPVKRNVRGNRTQ